MINKSCRIKRILAVVMVLCLLPICAPALADNYPAAVYSSKLAVYADASCTQKVAELDRYTVVTVTGVSGEVARIQYGGYTLYTASSGIRSVEDFAQSAEANQNTYVFETADTTSRKIAVRKGLQFNLLATKGDWALVEKDGYVGYTNKAHVSVIEAETEADPFQPETAPETETTPEADNSGAISGGKDVVIQTIEASVSATKLPVYKSASASSQKLGTLTYGQAVTVYAYNAEWAYIGLNNRYGFCALKGLVKGSITAPETETPSTDNNVNTDLTNAIPAKVSASSVVVYESASTSSTKLGKLNQGAQVNVLATNSNWAYIELNGNYGYCALNALAKLEETLPEGGSTEAGPSTQALGTATVIVASAKVGDSKKGGNQLATLSMGTTVNVYDHGSNWALVGYADGKYGYMAISSLSAQSYAELKEEDSGAAVTDLGEALLALGYFDGEVTVNYTSLTTEAVKRLQAACGMEQTGVASEALLRVLYSGNAPKSPILSISLSSGDKGENVKRIQNRLLALGYLSSATSVDGDYGSTTANAIGLFQKTAGASATGTADNVTIRALYTAGAPTLPSGSKPADYKAPASSGSSGNSSSISSDLASTTDTYVSGMSNKQKLEYVIYVAQQQLGKKYVFGATGPNTFDCSGLTYYCFKKIGVTLKRTAYSDGYDSSRQKISGISALKRGDLVFFNTVSDSDLSDHIGIYLGDGYFIHASSGAAKVVVSNLSSGYYNRVYSWGRRVLDT